MADPVIQLEHLTKDYPVGFWRPRPYRALDDLSLEVQRGEVFGCLGPNGAGKSTTLKLLMRLVFPTRGEARILGRPLDDLGMRRRVGFLPENPAFYDYLTGEELLTYYGQLCGLDGATARSRAAALLDRVGIGAERRLAVRRYSKGMVQRLGLAQALVNDPEVIFLDEPMSGLDPLGRRDVRALILQLRDEGRTIFFSSHILSDAETLCSRVAILAAGRLQAIGGMHELVEYSTRGWDLLLDGVTADLRASLAAAGATITTLGDDRVQVHLESPATPEPLLPLITAAGARVLALTPVRETLEDVFVRFVEGKRRDDPGSRPQEVA
jgi:ABC-2 type transport system ATP-binding protein